MQGTVSLTLGSRTWVRNIILLCTCIAFNVEPYGINQCFSTCGPWPTGGP